MVAEPSSLPEQLYTPAKRLVFQHIPKCGGSSLRVVLKRALVASGVPPSQIYVAGGGLPNLMSEADIERAAPRLKDAVAILAHIDIRLLPRLDCGTLVTCIRHPVARAVSAFNHFDLMKDPATMSLESLYCDHPATFSVKFRPLYSDESGPYHLLERSRYKFVAIHEHLEQDVPNMLSALGLPSMPMVHVDPAPARTKSNANRFVYDETKPEHVAMWRNMHLQLLDDHAVYHPTERILLYGNCQLAAIKSFVQWPASAHVEHVIVHRTECTQAEITQKAASADVIVTQNVTDNYRGKGYLGTSFVLSHASPSCEIVILDTCHFSGYHPDARSLIHNGIPVSSPSAYHHSTLLEYFKQGKSMDTFMQEVVDNPRYLSPAEVQAVVDASLAELRARAIDIDKKVANDRRVFCVHVADYIEGNYRTVQLFHTYNHPTHLLLTHLSERAARYLSARPQVIDRGNVLGIDSLLVYSSVIGALGIEAHDAHLGRAVRGARAICEQYYNTYQRLGMDSQSNASPMNIPNTPEHL